MTKNGDKIVKKNQKKRYMIFLQYHPPLIHTEQKKVLLNGVLQICGASAPNETRLHPQRVASYVKIAREGEVVVPLWQNNPALLQFSQFDQLHRVVYHLLVFCHLKHFPTSTNFATATVSFHQWKIIWQWIIIVQHCWFNVVNYYAVKAYTFCIANR